MLVLTRKMNQKIFIGENQEVEVELLSIQGQQVRIGIKAPKEVPIIRDDAANNLREVQQKAVLDFKSDNY